MKANRNCVICKSEYEYCNSCAKHIYEPSWKNSFCSENCKKIYEACSRYNADLISEGEARSILQTCDLKNRNQFTQATNETIKKLLGDVPVSRTKRKRKKKNIVSEEKL